MNITPEHAEEITKNIERASEFLQYLLDNPLEMEKIPNGSHIRFLDNLKNTAVENSHLEEKVLKVRKVYEFT
jgi:hypothetical protein